jgi:UDP-N-acetylmuramoyl-tripeptide--D-alanyl-D-alanine ligase
MLTLLPKSIRKVLLYVIIDNESYYIDQRTILVEDSLIALQELAKFHRIT